MDSVSPPDAREVAGDLVCTQVERGVIHQTQNKDKSNCDKASYMTCTSECVPQSEYTCS